jgi:hypothetical protein
LYIFKLIYSFQSWDFSWRWRFFWVMTPRSDVLGYQRFGGPCCPHFQGEEGRSILLRTEHPRLARGFAIFVLFYIFLYCHLLGKFRVCKHFILLFFIIFN